MTQLQNTTIKTTNNFVPHLFDYINKNKINLSKQKSTYTRLNGADCYDYTGQFNEQYAHKPVTSL